MDGRADRAKIDSLVRRMLSWILLGRRRFRRRHARDGRAACELFEMEVSERKDKLQRHRCKREPSAPSPIGPNPTHQANCPERTSSESTAKPLMRNAIATRAAWQGLTRPARWRERSAPSSPT